MFDGVTPAGPCAFYPMNDSWTDEPYAPGAVLIGDAAGWNDPIIGQGLAVALRDVRVVTDILRAGPDWSPAPHSRPTGRSGASGCAGCGSPRRSRPTWPPRSAGRCRAPPGLQPGLEQRPGARGHPAHAAARPGWRAGRGVRAAEHRAHPGDGGMTAVRTLGRHPAVSAPARAGTSRAPG